MGRLQTWGAAARHSRPFQVVAAVVVVALVAGGVVLATRSTAPAPSPPPKPAPSTRAVALGDSVPYGHGLANPYLTPQIGLPTGAVSQGPSTQAYPSLVAADFGLTMTVRPTNCHLIGDQLAISGAVADGADNTSRDGQCPAPPQQARNLADELAAADLAAAPGPSGPAAGRGGRHRFQRLPRVPAGPRPGGRHRPRQQLRRQRSRHADSGHGAGPRAGSLAQAIETLAPHASTVAVLDYYQPIPEPSQIAKGTSTSGLHTNLVCSGLKPNAASTFAAAQVVLAALNRAVAGAVADARAHHVNNVTLVDVAEPSTATASARPTPGSSRASPCPTPPWPPTRSTSWPPRPAPAPTRCTGRRSAGR